MPRNLSAAALAMLAMNLGTEPINIVEIQWVAGGPRIAYADRDVDTVPGKILEVSGLDDVIQVSGGAQSQQISLTLDDTDDSIKGIMDANDVHMRDVWVYQYFQGLDLDDKFLLFRGVINTPLAWDEGARTIKFDVVSKIEDVEVGFSIEEGDFENPPEELIGKPWPLVFGTCINVPALRATTARKGTLATGTGIRDWLLDDRLALANKLVCPQNFIGFKAMTQTGGNAWGAGPLQRNPVYETDPDCLKRKCEEIELLKLQIAEQSAWEISPVTIYNGNRFPQNVLVNVIIDGAKFSGKFNGNEFAIHGRLHPENDGSGNVIKTQTQNVIESECGTDVAPEGEEEELTNGVAGTDQTLLAKKSKATWDAYQAVAEPGFFWANAGSDVTLAGDEQILYIANLLPSTVLRVAAFRELNGVTKLVTVPDTYYTVRQTDYTSYTGVTEIVFERPLSGMDLASGGGWTDDIYVTLTSTVGPNTVDILEWFIDTYTDYSVDATSFDLVRTQIDNYPMHFPLLERKNLITVLQEIAFQARCSLWLNDDTFYIQYLAIEPTTTVDTITEDDVMPNSLRIEHTPTEDIVTKFDVAWVYDHSLDEPNRLILRHNVAKYGTHHEEYDFYCFNIQELVRKAATFWLIRKANTWRRVTCRTPINKLSLETFDAVSLTLPDAADGTIKAVVEKATFNSDQREIEFSIWTPCKSGTRVPYDLAWPAEVEEQSIFPTIDERDAGFAGSGSGPNFSTIAPDAHPLSNRRLNDNLWQSFNVVNDNTRADYGDKYPSDINDQKPVPNAAPENSGEISTGTAPLTSRGSQGSSCCQEAMNLAQKAMQEAQQAREQAMNAAQSAGQGEQQEMDEDDAVEQLPGGCGGNCRATVQITFITPTLVVLPPGSEVPFGTEPGDQGNLAVGSTGGSKCYTFNSQEAAAEFAASKNAEIAARDNYGWTVGKQEAWQVSLTADMGIDTDPESPTFGQPCGEPAVEERAMTNYSSDVVEAEA